MAFSYVQPDVNNATYLASAGIITKQSSADGYRLDATITRAEVIGMALKLKWTTLPENYVCKKYFSDTTKNDWMCRATELGADLGIVSRTNKKARPQDTITRAEALAILTPHVIDDELPLYSSNEWSQWQKNVFYQYIYATEIYANYFYTKRPLVDWTNIVVKYMPDSIPEVTWSPNRAATRAEVFGFAKNIREYKMRLVSGEVTKK